MPIVSKYSDGNCRRLTVVRGLSAARRSRSIGDVLGKLSEEKGRREPGRGF